MRGVRVSDRIDTACNRSGGFALHPNALSMKACTNIRAKAPLRLSFAGGGTDVSPFPETEGGAVLSATIDRFAYASLSPRSDGRVSVESVDFGLSLDFR